MELFLSGKNTVGVSPNYGSERYFDIDSVLGDKSGRYFGQGFRRVRYGVNSMEADVSGNIVLDIHINYPNDWSAKTTGTVSLPHLSTVDAAFLASALSEWYMHEKYDFSTSMSGTFHIQLCEITAGTSPDEELQNLRVQIHERSNDTIKDKRIIYTRRSEISVSIGTMKIKLLCLHSGVARKNVTRITEPDLNHSTHNYIHACNEAIMGRAQMDINNINIVTQRETATADLTFKATTREYRDLSFVEIVLASAQLAQALIYRVDSTSRSESNTLWMRDFTIEAGLPLKVKHELPIHLHTKSHKRMHIDGDQWSIFRFICFIGVVTTSFTFAHKLPACRKPINILNSLQMENAR